MRRALLLCVLAGCSIDHTGLVTGSERDAAADQGSPPFLDVGPSRPDASPRDASAPPSDAGHDTGRDTASPPSDVGTGPSCTDGVMNGDESDIDCGGACVRCRRGSTCRVGIDCETQHCDADDSRCRLPESCFDLLSGDATLATGTYVIDPDGSGDRESFNAWCDMTFDDGGWTLVVASNAMGPRSSVEGVVMPGTTTHLAPDDLEPLALGATQVHLRTSGAAEDRSVTSRPGSTTPIENLRALRMLEIERGGPSDSWMGPMADNVGFSCLPAADDRYPSVFHACGNPSGLHWFRGSTRWVNTEPNEPLELYVR